MLHNHIGVHKSGDAINPLCDNSSQLPADNLVYSSIADLISFGTSDPNSMEDNFNNVAVDIDMLEQQIRSKEESSNLHPGLIGEISNKQKRGGSGKTDSAHVNEQLDFDSLNEPVLETFKRDLDAAIIKFTHVFYPRNNDQLLRNWDLWGPLFVCVFLSIFLQAADNIKGPHFSEIFTLTFLGSCVVTLNMKLLGGKISFFQGWCVLGYCLSPCALAAFLCEILQFVFQRTTFLFSVTLLATAAGFSWATYAATAFLKNAHTSGRVALGIYPVFLFYFVVSWIILSHSSF